MTGEDQRGRRDNEMQSRGRAPDGSISGIEGDSDERRTASSRRQPTRASQTSPTPAATADEPTTTNTEPVSAAEAGEPTVMPQVEFPQGAT